LRTLGAGWRGHGSRTGRRQRDRSRGFSRAAGKLRFPGECFDPEAWVLGDRGAAVALWGQEPPDLVRRSVLSGSRRVHGAQRFHRAVP